MVVLYALVAVGLVGCAARTAAPTAAVLPEPAVVAPVETGPTPNYAALKAKADEAVTSNAERMLDIEKSCAEQWFESSIACVSSSFEHAASDYQAYYVEHPDPRRENSSIDALPRLGGPDSEIDQIAVDLGKLCEDRCRTARVSSIEAAVTAAIDTCAKSNVGKAACKVLSKKLAVNVRVSEVERWTSQCEDHCDTEIAGAKYKADIDRKRPRTQAQRAACEAACHRRLDGDWCGTPLMSCLSNCIPATARP